MEPFTLLITYFPQYSMYIFAIMGVCAITDACFPQPVAGSIWVGPRKVVSMFGGSFLNAANRIKPGSDAAQIASTSGRAAVLDPPPHDAVAAAALPITKG